MVRLADFVKSLSRMREEVLNGTYLELEGSFEELGSLGAVEIVLVCCAAVGGVCVVLGLCCCLRRKR